MLYLRHIHTRPDQHVSELGYDRGIALPLHPAIKTRLVEKAGDTAHRPRPRGTGKLLTSVGNVGLALLRIEHVFATRHGDAVLELETESETSAPKTFQVAPWEPPGWPEIPAPSDV